MKHLKFGYTTGTHTAAVFKSALIIWSEKEIDDLVDGFCRLSLANGDSVRIQTDIVSWDKHLLKVSTIKTDNDDYDVTKGCKIMCILSDDKSKIEDEVSQINHHPYIIEADKYTIYLYAGKGLGVVTKKGLKVQPGYPAINPVPLKQIKDITKEYSLVSAKRQYLPYYYCAVQVENGETLARQTANPKMGILGGISILGTTGIVKPVSVDSYLESIKAEISVARESRCPVLVYSLGNSSYQFASNYFQIPEECLIETGNFIFESLRALVKTPFTELYFIAGLGKMTKLAQGFKNTHHQYGTIDFKKVKTWLVHKAPELKEDLFSLSFNTTKQLSDYLFSLYSKGYYKNLLFELITNKACAILENWIYLLKKDDTISLTRVTTICLDEFKNKWSFSIELNQ